MNSTPTWVIQDSNLNFEEHKKVAEAIRRVGVPIEAIGIIPFEDFMPKIEADGKMIFYGSTKLVELAYKRPEYRDSVFFSPAKFRWTKWAKEREGELINEDWMCITIAKFMQSQVFRENHDFFIRPVNDLKLFAGTILNKFEFNDWYEQASLNGENFGINQEVIIAPPRNIELEYRFVIVNHEIIDGTRYYKRGHLSIDKVEPEAMAMAKKFAQGWTPHDVVVMDMGKLEDGVYGIIEFNCFNASGFYGHDLDKIIRAVTDYVTEI